MCINRGLVYIEKKMYKLLSQALKRPESFSQKNLWKVTKSNDPKRSVNDSKMYLYTSFA